MQSSDSRLCYLTSSEVSEQHAQKKNNSSNDKNITIIVSNSTNSIFYTLPTQSTENLLISKTLAMYKYHGTTEVMEVN